MNGRLGRFGFTLSLALALALSAGLTVGQRSAAASGVPDARELWNRVCVTAAGGAVQTQEVLVCIHVGFPIWGATQQLILKHVCESALHGTYVRRSEFPVEYAVCFL
jgi:hypothetical protein